MMKKMTALVAVCLASCACRAQGAAETWRVTELPFESAVDYDATGADGVRFDAVFTHASGETLARPGFWDGGRAFRVRFAPTRPGAWRWRTTCPSDASLDSREGALTVKPYAGPLEIYRRGFLKTAAGHKYFTYADGTPFFYLGDTHWSLYREEIDEGGPHAGTTGATSHFKYIVDRRVEQGFTVFQSEPIGAAFRLADGRVDAADIPGFRLADRYYRYIADAGLVHANAMFFFASEMNPAAAEPKALERLSRYWSARYGAYPVLWTLAQEIDNDFYFERHHRHNFYCATNNPWVEAAAYLHASDAYGHPLSGHQENTGATTVTGRGTNPDKSKISCNGRSAFADAAVAARTGHSWWAAQWAPALTACAACDAARDYWSDPRPAVNYEGRYCGLWTKDFGARAQAYLSFLNGFFGYGYGAIDIWLYQSTYDIDRESHDGVDTITPADKRQRWSTSVTFPSALQMAHVKTFFTSFPWWEMKPGFAGPVTLRPTAGADIACSYATCGGGKGIVLYLYGKNRLTGTLTGLRPHASYAVRWFNTRTGAWSDGAELTVDAQGEMTVPERPDAADWALVLSRHESAAPGGSAGSI